MTKQELPPGWDEQRIASVLAHYDAQTPAEELAEFEAAWESRTTTMVEVPLELLPAVRSLIERFESLWSKPA